MAKRYSRLTRPLGSPPPAISMFLDAARALKDTGGKIVATGPQPRVGEVLQRLRLEKLLPVAATVEEGVKKVKGIV